MTQAVYCIIVGTALQLCREVHLLCSLEIVATSSTEAPVTTVLQLEIRITCTCDVWGMQTTVESMMIAKAEESMAEFLAWAKKHCADVLQVLSTHLANFPNTAHHE